MTKNFPNPKKYTSLPDEIEGGEDVRVFVWRIAVLCGACFLVGMALEGLIISKLF